MKAPRSTSVIDGIAFQIDILALNIAMPVRRSNCPATVIKLPNRGPVTQKIAAKPNEEFSFVSAQSRKVAPGGGDDWEEF